MHQKTLVNAWTPPILIEIVIYRVAGSKKKGKTEEIQALAIFRALDTH